jgi:hypothetical protein
MLHKSGSTNTSKPGRTSCQDTVICNFVTVVCLKSHLLGIQVLWKETKT